MSTDIILSTTNQLEGYYIEQYLGIINRDVVFKNSFLDSLGSSIDTLVSGFRLRAVEIQSASELVQNAKEYLIGEFEREARRRRANAVIGVDIEAAIGSDVVKVSMNGTAVIVKELVLEGASSLKKTRIIISESNALDHFLPIAIECENMKGEKAIALEIAKVNNDYNIGDMLADIIVTNEFDDEMTYENVCFLNFTDSSVTKLKCDPFPVDIPEYMYRCMKSCALRVKKYYCNNELKVVNNNEFKDVITTVEEKRVDTQMQIKDLISVFAVKNSVSEMLDYLKTTVGKIPPDKYARLYEILQARESGKGLEDKNVEFTLTRLRVEFKNELFGDVPIEPIIIGDNQIKCPCCGRVQQANRRTCFSCGIKLDVAV